MNDAPVLGSDAARAVGRFNADGVLGYQAATAPNAPVRETRSEAVADEWVWRIRPRATSEFPQRVIVTFNSDSGSGAAVFRDADSARGLLATEQSKEIHEAATRYLEHVGAASTPADLALFDLEGIA